MSESEIEAVKKIISKYSNRKYKCTVVDDCVASFVEDLKRALNKATKTCFVEYFNKKYVVVVCNLFDVIYVELDYDIVEIVNVKPRIVEIIR